MTEQLMVLVNEHDEQIGLMPKMQTHEEGLLHRAFSVFLFDDKGDMILQQRANSKYHSPNLWTNACCSHPLENESPEDAALRRLKEELGIQTTLTPAFQFIYKAELENGLIEHELDHVFLGIYDGDFLLNSNEVSAVKTISMSQLQEDIITNDHTYTSWFKIAFPLLINHLEQ
jgi:isopentenyl-diphosphate Delta-isomerase